MGVPRGHVGTAREAGRGCRAHRTAGHKVSVNRPYRRTEQRIEGSEGVGAAPCSSSRCSASCLRPSNLISTQMCSYTPYMPCTTVIYKSSTCTCRIGIPCIDNCIAWQHIITIVAHDTECRVCCLANTFLVEYQPCATSHQQFMIFPSSRFMFRFLLVRPKACKHRRAFVASGPA